MAIAKLTQDDLREPDREVTQLARINSVIDAANNMQGDGTPGPGTFTDLTATGDTTLGDGIDDRVTVKGASEGIANPTGGCLAVRDETPAAQGVGGQIVFRGQFQSGQYTQFAAISAFKESATVDGTQYGSALIFNTRTQGGNNDEKMRLTSEGVQLAPAAGKVAFYGTTPIAKQTGVAVTAEAIHAALVALGLIGA